MINKLKKYFKNKKAVGSISTAIKVVTACVLGATVLVGGVALTNDVVLPNTETKVASVASYQGDGVGGGSVGGVTPVSVPVAYNHDDPALHPTGTIPTGCIYYTNVEQCQWCGADKNINRNTCSDCGYTFTAAATAITSGNPFPAIMSHGDIFETSDYYYGLTLLDYDDSNSGWYVVVKDKTKTFYEAILESINGKSVKTLENTFTNCTSLTSAPEIPNSVTNMWCTFAQCTSLTTAPVIPDGVTNMEVTFHGFTSLGDTITINANPLVFNMCLHNTQITEVVGDTTLKAEILATK